jgi:hypothetical protein
MRSALKAEGVECVALADVDQEVLDRRAVDAKEAGGKTPRLYRDYRKLLDDKEVDAVIVGTPDHWHCLILVDALAAGQRTSVAPSRGMESSRLAIVSPARASARYARKTRAPALTLIARPIDSARGTASRQPRYGWLGERRIRQPR